MRRRLTLILALPVLLIAAAYWLAGQDATLRWALERVAAASAGRLTFSGVSGNLLGSVRVAQARFHHPKASVAADGLALDLSLAALLGRRLQIDRLTVVSVQVDLPVSDEPLRLPDSLALPLAVEIGRLEVGRILVRRGAFSLVLHRLQAGLRSSGRTHHLTLRGVDSPWGRLQGTLQLAAAAPFDLASHLELAPRLAQVRPPLADLPRLSLDLRGPLAALQAELGAQGPWLQASARARIRAFDPAPLDGLEARLQRLDLKALGQGLPGAVLSGSLQAKPAGERRLAGRMSLSNHAAAGLDQGGLPLTTLAAGFVLAPDQLVLDDLRLGLRRGAGLAGRARLGRAGLAAELTSPGLDLSAFHDRLHPTRLAGQLSLRADAGGQRLLARLADARQRYEVDASRQGDRIRVHQARIRNGDSGIDLHGEIATRGRWPFTAEARLTRLDPAAFGAYPAARLNATVEASGQLEPAWQARVSARVADSLYRQRPLSGWLQAGLQADRLVDARGEARWAGSHAAFRGGLGRPEDQLDLDFSVADLKPFHPDWAGQASGSARLNGRLDRPGVSLRARAAGIAGPGELGIDSAEVSASAAPDLAAPLAVDARLTGARLAGRALDQASLNLAGSGRRHRLNLTAASRGLDLSARLAGGLDPALAWQGQVEAFQFAAQAGARPWRLRLAAPADLALDRSGIRLGAASLDSDRARFQLDGLALRPGALHTAGRFSGLPVAGVAALLGREVRGDASVAGDWRIEAGERLNGHLKFWHEAGAWRLAAVGTDPHGLNLVPSRARVEATARDDRIEVTTDVAMKNGSRLDLRLATRAGRQGEAWVVPAEAPLSLKARGDFPSLAWLGPLLPRDLAIDGRLGLDLTAEGSWRQPRVSGHIEGSRIGIRHFSTGADFSDGSLRARFDDNWLILDGLDLKSGEGQLHLDGRARLGGDPQLHLRFQGAELGLLGRRDLDLDSDLAGELAVDRRGAKLSAKARVNRALLILDDTYAPSLSPDVRIKGREAKARQERGLPLSLDVAVDLGKDFRVRSSDKSQLLGGKLPFQTSGLRTQVTGQMRLSGERGKSVRADGEVRLVDGSYYLLGQRLEIERGNLRFDGPLLNPALDIIAVREKPQMKAGMSITGTANAPRTRLFSEPEVPDQEKLSWLLFGRGGQPVDTSLGGVAGAGGGLTSFGFQISDRLSVAYEQGASGTEQFVTFYSNLTDRLSVEARAGDETALRLFYTFTLGRPAPP